MTLLLGIDTGGTFTDAVLFEPSADGSAGAVIAKAKSLTTRHDFANGIAGAAEQVLMDSQCDAEKIGMVSLSTTLATNALVEGQGGRIALIAIGFEERDLKNAGLADALAGDPVIMLDGGHNTHGGEAQPLDVAPLEEQLEDLAKNVTGFAIAGYFAVRNPSHELTVRDLILEKTGKAATCSHELSARLNGPKRALTTVLNARLVPMITRLIEATKRSLEKQNIDAPLMIVRGDGALVSADFAVRRPIETILSGPAASLVGARFLTGLQDAFVNDIGGTTSDIAMLHDGKPRLDPDGARVGGYRTMVEAVAMNTFGLGGDSEVSLGGNALRPSIKLGPRRLVPISLLAKEHGSIVHTSLDRQLNNALIGRYDGRFAIRTGAGLEADLSAKEIRLYEKITHEPSPLDEILQGAVQSSALARLVVKGLVQISGLTPSDAMHVLDKQTMWDKSAALKAVQLFGKQRDGSGHAFCSEPISLATMIIAQVQRRSAEVVLETAFQIDGKDGAQSINHAFIQEVLDERASAKPTDASVRVDVALSKPLIGLGASAHSYHPEAARLLSTDAVVPDHADVSNAIGAVVGQVSVKSETTVSQPVEGRFQVTGIEQPFGDELAALEAAKKLAGDNATLLADEAGAEEFELSIQCEAKRAEIESRTMLIEAKIIATATGRPGISSGSTNPA